MFDIYFDFELSIQLDDWNMFLKLFDEIVKNKTIFKIKKMNVKMNLLIVRFTVTFKQTLNEILNE